SLGCRAQLTAAECLLFPHLRLEPVSRLGLRLEAAALAAASLVVVVASEPGMAAAPNAAALLSGHGESSLSSSARSRGPTRARDGLRSRRQSRAGLRRRRVPRGSRRVERPLRARVPQLSG